jgi:hypothetical protein
VSAPHELLSAFAAAEVVDEHLFYGLVVGHEDVADGVAADEVADFFGEVFGVIAGAFEGLGHEDDLQTGLTGNVFGILDVAEENEVAEAIHFGVGAENVDRFADVAGGKGIADIGEHFFEDGSHVGKIARILGIDAAGSSLSAVGEAEKQIADALQTDHEFHAGEKFAGFGGLDFGDDGGDGAVDFHVEPVELAFALVQRVEQRTGAGGDAFRGSSCSFFGQPTGFDGTTDDVLMRRFGSEAFDVGSAHKGLPLARTGTARAD